MNRTLWAAAAAYTLGAAAVAWVALGSAGAHPLALAMTLAIGTVYAIGGTELWRFQRDTQALQRRLADIVGDPAADPAADTKALAAELSDWLATLPNTLRDAVRRRVEGERAGLPGPALTPYLVGLLVLLGMLGTFLGLVVTLNGTVLALERTTDLAAMRAALAAPVKGLGLAFGTSVAGVAASAMLGLVSALARRARADVVRALDRAIAGPLREHGRERQREARRSRDLAQVADAMLAQSALLPGVVAQVQALMARLDTDHAAHRAQLLEGQARFHHQAQAQLMALSESVGRDLRDSLAEAARLAGATLQPVAEATMAGIARESASVQARLAETTQTQLEGLTRRTEATVAALGDGLRHQASTLAAEVAQAHAALQASADAREAERRADATRALQDLAATLQRQDTEARSLAEARLAQLGEGLAQGAAALQQQVATLALDTLAELGTLSRGLSTDVAAQAERTVGALSTQAQRMVDAVSAQTQQTVGAMARLTETAAEAPRAAADVISALRGQLSESLQRDQALLAERSRLTEALQALIVDAQRATAAQEAAVQGLVGAAEGLLQRTGERLGEQLQGAAEQQAEVAVRLNAGAVEVASLGEAFGAAVAQFGANSGALVDQLGRIEVALDQSAARHDEQLAYYVAQAREVIDLSLSAQQPLVEALQRLAAPQPAHA